MEEDDFEWDDAKAASNRLKHDTTFEAAREAFKDVFAIEWMDHRQGDEERLALLGMVENRLVFVSFTLRGERIRIISARKPESHERRRYHNENREA